MHSVLLLTAVLFALSPLSLALDRRAGAGVDEVSQINLKQLYDHLIKTYNEHSKAAGKLQDEYERLAVTKVGENQWEPGLPHEHPRRQKLWDQAYEHSRAAKKAKTEADQIGMRVHSNHRDGLTRALTAPSELASYRVPKGLARSNAAVQENMRNYRSPKSQGSHESESYRITPTRLTYGKEHEADHTHGGQQAGSQKRPRVYE